MQRLRFPFLGYTVILHWSWLIAVSLLTWGLATGYFPETMPDYPHFFHWLSGLFATLLLFFSVLLHECAHAGVATYHGVKIHEIMLHIVGGWTMLPKEFATPKLEALVAIAGPLCSAFIALLLYPWSDFPVAQYIMHFNLILAVYNLLPAFPMDGGRIYRARLWSTTGSFSEATERASLLGKRIAIAMILIGIGGLIVQQSTFWLMIGGLILRMIADGTHHSVAYSQRLTGLVRDVMIPVRHVLCLDEQMRITEAQHLFLQYGFHGYPVLRQGTVIGVLDHELVRTHESWLTPGDATIAALVTPLRPDLTIAPTELVRTAFDQMLLAGTTRLLVFHDRQFRGLLAKSAVTRLREFHRPESSWVTLTGRHSAPAGT
jgi:Zn-dependent protease/CBS domain-containing protein